MKFLMAAMFLVAGCSSSGGGNSSTQQKPFTGSPTSLNGRWSGDGTVVYGSQAPEQIDVEVIVSRLPTGFDLSIQTADDQGRQQMNTSLTGHRIVDNQIFDVRDNANVGSVGSQGFTIGRPNMGTIEARKNDANQLVIHADVDYGSGYHVVYDAILSFR